MEHSADDPFAAPRRRGRPQRRDRGNPPPPREPQGDLLKRRLIALVAGVLVLVLLLFGFRACLDARKARSYEDYLRDVESLATDSEQLAADFFQRFRDPGELSKLEFQAQLGSARGSAESLLERAEGLDNPDEVADAQEDLEMAFELRRDGVASVVEQTEIALGRRGSIDAVRQIATDMRQFLASDVLYDRAAAEIERVLAEEELPGRVPESQFLPEPIAPWLDDLELASLLASVAAQTTGAGDASRGTEISSTALRPGNTILNAEGVNTINRVPEEVEVTILNGGVEDERDLTVSVELLGGADTVAGEATIPRVGPGQTSSVLVPIEGEIPAGLELTLVVTVLPVPGETVIDNNESTYTVTLEPA